MFEGYYKLLKTQNIVKLRRNFFAIENNGKTKILTEKILNL